MAKSDARKLAVARDALQRLIASGDEGKTGKDLFGTEFVGRWGRNLMRRLMAAGLVTMKGEGGAGPAHVFVAVRSLEPFVGDDVRLATLLWPNLSPAIGPGDLIDAEFDEAEEPPGSEPPPDLARDDLVPLVAGAPEENLLETAVKLCAATLQNVVYLRQQFDALKQEFTEFKKAWE